MRRSVVPVESNTENIEGAVVFGRVDKIAGPKPCIWAIKETTLAIDVRLIDKVGDQRKEERSALRQHRASVPSDTLV